METEDEESQHAFYLDDLVNKINTIFLDEESATTGLQRAIAEYNHNAEWYYYVEHLKEVFNTFKYMPCND